MSTSPADRNDPARQAAERAARDESGPFQRAPEQEAERIRTLQENLREGYGKELEPGAAERHADEIARGGGAETPRADVDAGAGSAARPGTPAGQLSPGDQAPAGTTGTGENVCPACGGSGRAETGSACAVCSGTGTVTTGIGGG